MTVSLIELRDSRWKVTYDEKTGQMTEDDVTLMLTSISVSIRGFYFSKPNYGLSYRRTVFIII